MKTLFTFMIIFLVITEVRSEPPVTKYRSSVSQNPVGNYLSCLDPGKKSCKWSMGTKDEEYADLIK